MKWGRENQHSTRSDQVTSSVHMHMEQRLTWLKQVKVKIIQMKLKTRTHVTLVDLQLDAQNSYLFTYNTFIKILCMFRALPCSSSGGLRRSCIYAASGIVTLCR